MHHIFPSWRKLDGVDVGCYYNTATLGSRCCLPRCERSAWQHSSRGLRPSRGDIREGQPLRSSGVPKRAMVYWSVCVQRIFEHANVKQPTPPSVRCTAQCIFRRLGMILFGDIDFFTSDSVRNKSGQRLWLEFLSLLEAGGHVYRDGLPAVCETHKTHVDLSSPKAFDENVPDGGCRVVCGAVLACDGGHPCPRRYAHRSMTPVRLFEEGVQIENIGEHIMSFYKNNSNGTFGGRSARFYTSLGMPNIARFGSRIPQNTLRQVR